MELTSIDITDKNSPQPTEKGEKVEEKEKVPPPPTEEEKKLPTVFLDFGRDGRL